jgi:hypothetical protein
MSDITTGRAVSVGSDVAGLLVPLAMEFSRMKKPDTRQARPGRGFDGCRKAYSAAMG